MSANLNWRKRDKVRELEVQQENPDLDKTPEKGKGMFKFLKSGQNGGNSYNQLYAEKAFDFYGQEIRLHKDEAKRTV